MMLDLDDGINAEFESAKERFLRKESSMKYPPIKLREIGLSDDTIFIAHLLGVYKASIEMGLV